MNNWTNTEKELLETLYASGKSMKDIAGIIGRPQSGVETKAYEMRLSKKYPGVHLKYIHDEHFDRLYRIYHHMKDRCDNPNHHEYHNYGGKGVSICQEWREDFLNFKNWALNNGYCKDLTLDRINSDGNYEPDNCQWITRGENTAKSNHIQHRRANRGNYIGQREDGTWIEFENANEFARVHHLDANIVRQRAASKLHSVYNGWRFFYADEKERYIA